MRKVVTQTVNQLACPSVEMRELAAQHGGNASYNEEMQNNWPCLTTLELRQPNQSLAPPKSLTVAAWNMERCKRVEESAELIRRAEVDLILATEMDHGMARSGQRHTTRELANALDMGYVFGTEFVELGVGDNYETELFNGVTNKDGLHGNAILSRFPITNVALLPLDAGGLWFVSQPKNDGQLRIGGRMAISAQIKTSAGPLTVVAAHYESESDPQDRCHQTQTLLEHVKNTYGPEPTIIGGDLNTNALCDGNRRTADILNSPQSIEPTFTSFEQAGFDWRSANTGLITTRAAPGRAVRDPLQMLDWLLVRDCVASDPQIHAAISESGLYLSDHEMITAKVNT